MADQTIVDIIPVYEMGDAKKVFNYGPINLNQIVTSVLNQLKMPEGVLTDYPDIGCFENLMNFSFTELETEIVEAVSSKLSSVNGDGISINFIYNDNLKENVTLDITIDGIPNYKLVADLNPSNQNIKILNPRLVEV